MTDEYPGAVALDDDAVDEFLGPGGTGVLALAREGESYAIPVSYGFDGDERIFYLRLAFGPSSHKRTFISGTDVATLVVQRDTDDGWTSAVARGSLSEVTEAALSGAVSRAIHTMDIPFVEIYDRPARDLDYELFRLAPDSLTGRRERGGGSE
jgi:hypothetical protein